MFSVTQRDPMLELVHHLEHRMGRIFTDPFRTAFEWPVREAAATAWQQVAEEKAEKVHRYERTYGAFERTFRLSASIDPNKIKATYDLGVLTITLPKAETAKPHLITVEVTAQKALKA